MARSSRSLRDLHACFQSLDSAMTYDSNVACGSSEVLTYGIGRPIVIERHHQHRALAFRQTFETLLQTVSVQRVRVVLEDRFEFDRKRVEEPLASRATAPPVDHDLSTGAEYEGSQPLGLADGAGTQFLQHHQQDVLYQVCRSRVVAQVSQAVEPDARREAAAQL